jgi:hypothetical protein
MSAQSDEVAHGRPGVHPVIGLQLSPEAQSAGVIVWRHEPVAGTHASIVQSM